MYDKIKEKTGKAVSDDSKVATNTMHNDAGVKTQKVSDEVKTGVHKSVSDAKIVAHGPGSTMKKAGI